jgi:hypothetical protein
MFRVRQYRPRGSIASDDRAVGLLIKSPKSHQTRTDSSGWVDVMKIIGFEEHYVLPAVAEANPNSPRKLFDTMHSGRFEDSEADGGWPTGILDLGEHRIAAMDAAGIHRGSRLAHRHRDPLPAADPGRSVRPVSPAPDHGGPPVRGPELDGVAGRLRVSGKRERPQTHHQGILFDGVNVIGSAKPG